MKQCKISYLSNSVIEWRPKRGWSSDLTPLFYELLKHPEKRERPLISTWHLNQELQIFFADFDCLSSEFNTFDDLASYLVRFEKGNYLTLRSASGKVKCLFVGRLPIAQTPNEYKKSMQTEVEKVLNAHLPIVVKGAYDKSPGGFSLNFLDSSQFDKIVKNLHKLTPHELALLQPDITPVEPVKPVEPTPIKKEFDYKWYDGRLHPQVEAFIDGNETTEKIIRTVLGNHIQLETGFNVVQHSLAKHLGLSPRTVNRVLHRAREAKLFTIVNSSYRNAPEGPTYAMTWAVAQLQTDLCRQNVKSIKAANFPSYVPVGEFNRTVPKALATLGVEEFKVWAQSAANTPDRVDQVKNLLRRVEQGKFQLRVTTFVNIYTPTTSSIYDIPAKAPKKPRRVVNIFNPSPKPKSEGVKFTPWKIYEGKPNQKRVPDGYVYINQWQTNANITKALNKACQVYYKLEQTCYGWQKVGMWVPIELWVYYGKEYPSNPQEARKGHHNFKDLTLEVLELV